jgi:SAM-dependent methyltransferase
MPADRPRVTVFTSAHRPPHLEESLASLLRQSFERWEWVVVVDQGARWRPEGDDPRIRVIVGGAMASAGAAKRMACSAAGGEILVELDDGDVLASDALQEIVRAFDGHPDVGFVYSNVAPLGEDGIRDESRHDPRDGWTLQPVGVDGRSVLMTEALAPDPHNVSHSRYAPQHVRAFRRSTYELAGGYDAARQVLEGQDLMCRMYQHTGFHLIPRCLYLERMPGAGAPSDARGDAEIEKAGADLYEGYVQANALAWARRRELLALDLGAAHNKPPGYMGVDQYEGEGVDIVADVTRGLDLPDSSVGVVRAVDFLEHVPDKIAIFNELHRVLAHGGMLLSLTPSTDGRGAFQDPTHVAYYNENSFWYFTDRTYSQFVPPIHCRFQVSRLATLFPSPWHEEHRISYVQANLVAIKDGPRQGGLLTM